MVATGAAGSRLVIRADAGVGLGHVTRCLALAQAWRAAGGTTTFVSACEGDELQTQIEATGCELVPIRTPWPDERDLKLTLAVLSHQHDPRLVLDGYHFDAAYQRQVKALGHRLLVIDDFKHADHYYADALLNQNIGAERLAYPCLPGTRLMLGTRYALIRHDFVPWRGRHVQTPSMARRLLVTLGGRDPENQTLKVIRALQLLRATDLEVNVVVGSHNSNMETLQGAARQGRVPIRLVQNPPNMPELMAWADVAVSGGGSTCWELAFMGVPNLVLVFGENQRAVAEGLDRAGVSQNLGWYCRVGETDLAAALDTLIADQLRRELMRRKGRELVDGRGSHRVVQHLKQLETR